MKLAKLKKTLAVLLSAAMVFSAVPVTAMADVVESEAIEVSGAEETVESEDAATEEVDAEIEESDESQDVEVSGVEEETEAVEELDAVEEDDVAGSEEEVNGVESKSWSFRKGSDLMGETNGSLIQGNTGTINGLEVDATASGAKFDSLNRDDWAQANTGTKIKVPVTGKCVVTVTAYSAGAFTINGVAATDKALSVVADSDYAEVVYTKNDYLGSIEISDYVNSWNFRSGSSLMGSENGKLIQGNTGTVSGLNIDATASGAKFDSLNRTDWAQANTGTKIKIPVYGKSAVTVTAYSAGAFTMNGVAAAEPTMTVTSDNGYVEVVYTKNDYLGSIEVVDYVTSWNFRNGSDLMGETNGVLIQGNTGTVNTLKVDATAATAKFDTKNRGDWAQANTGTIITVPVYVKSDVTVVTYTKGVATINGKATTETSTKIKNATKDVVIEFTANDYLGSILIEEKPGEAPVGDAYIAKTFDAVPVVDRKTAGLKAHIFNAETGKEVDAVASFDENMYMGNSSTSGTVGLQKSVADNLVWVDEDSKTLVITPHTDEKGYSILEAGETYYVTLDEGLVTVGGADAAIANPDDWTFTATAAEDLADGKVMNVGPADTDDFRTLTGAFNYLRKNNLDGDWTINVAKGVYHERPFYYGDANITIKGASAKGDFGKDVLFTWKNCDDWTGGGARGRCTFLVQGNGDMNMIGISMVNTFDRKKDFDDGSTQAETLGFDGTGKLFVYDCGFDSHQDTLYIGKKGNRSWFYKSYIAGDVDFLWGYPGVCLFEECTLRCYADTAKETPLAHLIASRTEVKDDANLGANKGFVIMNSTIQMDKNVTVTYARNSGADTNAAIFNNEFTGEGTLNPALYGSAPGYEERDINNDLIVGYMDGDNTYNGTKVDTKDRLEHCGALSPRMQNREYSGRYVILNRGYDFAKEKFVTAENIWDATALATELGVATTADDSAKQIFVEPVGYKNVIGGDSVQYKAYDMNGTEVTDGATWSVTEVDADDPKATGNTAAVDASMDATVKGKLNTKLTTRSKVTVTATLDGKSDDGLCTVIPEYVPADTVQLSLVSGAVDLYGTKTLGGVLSCSTNDQDDVTVTETTWTTSASANALFYDEATKTFVDKVTTKTCSVMVYGAGSGKATITASTKDGGSDTFELTVYDDQTVWLPFVAGVLVNTDVQSGKWGTFNGMFIDTVTYKGKVGMKNSSPTRTQTRNAILNFPVNYDATVKVTLDAAPTTPVKADLVESRAYQGLDTINNTNITWDEATLTYTIDHKAADAKAASVTEPAADAKAAQGPDAGIPAAELAKAQYLQLSYGSKDVYVTKYVITKPGHQDIEDVADDNVQMAVESVTLSRETLRIDEGASYKVSATAKYPDGKTTNEVTWSSNDESIATVAADGTITGVKEGVTTITASKDAQSDTVVVTVKKPGRAVITDKAQWITDDMYEVNIAAEKMNTEPVDTKDGLITFNPSILASTGKSKSRVDADSAPVKFDDNNEYTRNINMQAGMDDVEGKNSGAYFEFETSDAAEVVVYWKSSSGSAGGRKMGIVKVDGDTTTIIDEDDEDFDIDAETGKTVAMALVKKFSLTEGGLYRIGATSGGAKIYAIKVAVGGSVEPEPGPGPEPEPTPDEPGTVSDDTVDKTGDPVLSEKTAAEVSANYADMAAASAKGAADKTVVVKGAVSDTGVLIQNYKKGKVKSVTISTNSVSDCKVTVNAKVKVFLPAGFGGAGTISNMTGAGNTKPLKVNKKGAVSLKAFKGVSKYDVTFTGASGKLTITVVNLAFDKALKKLQVSANAVLTVRPTLQAGKVNDIKSGAGFLNGVWMVDKTIISKPGQTVSGKNGAKVTLNANGTVTVTNVAGKGNVKLTYMLNGKKYATALKVQKKASGSEGAYMTAGLLK